MAYTATNFVEKMKAMTCKGTFKWRDSRTLCKDTDPARHEKNETRAEVIGE